MLLKTQSNQFCDIYIVKVHSKLFVENTRTFYAFFNGDAIHYFFKFILFFFYFCGFLQKKAPGSEFK